LPAALKELASLPRKMRGQVDERIQGLAQDPRPPGCKVLKGEWSGLMRIRSGDHRIIYRVEDDRLIVTVVRIADRKDAYE
jgi:mRNA interferase RelE/StbE